MQLAEWSGLRRLLANRLSIGRPGGATAHLKIPTLVTGMVAMADSIDEMALLWHGGMDRLFTRYASSSTLGTILRSFTPGHIRQLDAVTGRLYAQLRLAAPLPPRAADLGDVDIDETVRQTDGCAKAGD